MIKLKSLVICVFMMFICATVFAQQKVAIFLEAPLTFCNDEKVHTMVDEKAQLIFTKDKFDILPLSDSLSAIQLYREEHDMASVVSSGWSGYAVPMKKENVQEIGKNLACDYVFFVRLTNDVPRYSSGFMSVTAKTNITCDARVMNVAKGEYTFMKQILTEGKSTAIYMGAPSFEKAYFRAFEKALKDIKIDTNKI
ncbi:MAG: hypothetical protein Q4E64_09640 [Phascolarctobacterium sp.]|nr:hypothetical protein [Phascolarctobacterium sp.]